jgi:hypothetical protein
LIYDQNARFGIIRSRNVVKRDVNVFPLRFAVLDEHGGDTLGDFAFSSLGCGLPTR